MDQIGVIENTSIESVKNSDKNSTLMESKNSDPCASLCPITPYLTKEKVKIASRLKLNNDANDLSTPIEDVFDHYTPGLNEVNHLETAVARKLDFNSNKCVSKNETENGSLMETVYESVLEAIICKQAEDILAEILAPDSSHDVLMTPPSVARVTGLADTCPGAPSKPKPVRNKRTVDMTLCRKLDFDSCV